MIRARIAATLWLASVPLVPVLAHEPFLGIFDNGDGTIAIEAGFSDGASTAGVKVQVRDLASDRVLDERPLDAAGLLTLPMPSVPYRVRFDGGPGHTLAREGPFTERAAAPPPVASPDPLPTSPGPVPAAKGIDSSLALLVGVFFLFGAVAYGLGYWAGLGLPR